MRKMATTLPRSPRTRDREATMRRIREAAVSVLTEEGIQGLTIQAVAHKASVHKKLIYYYFKDLQGLRDVVCDALVAELEICQRADFSSSYGLKVSSAIRTHARRLRSTPAMTQLLASDLAGTHAEGFAPLLSLAAQPEVADLGTPPNADAAIASAVMLAGVIYLILLDRSGRSLFGVEVGEPEGLNRLLKVVGAMATVVLEPKAVDASP